MTPRDAWQRLGIDPTDDTRAIRRAYADRLRAVGDDAEPAVFMQLRDARDLALATRHMPLDDDHDDDSYDEDDGDWDFDDGAMLVEPYASDPHPSDPLPSESEQSPEPGDAVAAGAEVSTADAASAHPGQALYELLVEGDAAAPLTPGEIDAGTGCLTAIAAEAAAATVERHAEIDAWVASLLARSTARSDPLIGPAGRLFGWQTRTEEFHLPPALDHLVARQKGMNFVAAVSERKHPLHRAWAELTRPATDRSRRGWFVKRSDVGRLLATVRRDLPHLEDEHFDAWRVGLWERAEGAAGGRRFGWIALVFVIAIVRFIAASTGGDHATTDATPRTAVFDRMRDVATDSDAVLQGITPDAPRYADLPAASGLRRFLDQRWQQASSTGSARSDWIKVYHDFLLLEIADERRSFSYPVLAQLQRYRRDTIRSLLKTAPNDCEADLSNGPPSNATQSDAVFDKLDASYKRYLGLALAELEPPRRAPEGTITYSIPGPVVGRAMKLSGLPEARLRAAIGGTGPIGDRCTARAALIDAVLEQPKAVALPLLRVL